MLGTQLARGPVVGAEGQASELGEVICFLMLQRFGERCDHLSKDAA